MSVKRSESVCQKDSLTNTNVQQIIMRNTQQRTKNKIDSKNFGDTNCFVEWNGSVEINLFNTLDPFRIIYLMWCVLCVESATVT